MLKKLVPVMIKQPIKSYLQSKRTLYSQAGQDLWVFGEVFDEKRGGFFLDIGAHDGVDLSNTYVLEKRYGWKGICVEANPDTYEQLRKNRGVTCINRCLDDKVGVAQFAKNGALSGIVSDNTDNRSAAAGDVVSLETTTLARLLQDTNAPTEIDYMSIDIEGAEERVLSRFPFAQWKIKCLTIERPTAALRGVLSVNGFILVKEIRGLDCFYLHKDLADRYVNSVCSFYGKKFLAARVAD